jgi:hypothetical protein
MEYVIKKKKQGVQDRLRRQDDERSKLGSNASFSQPHFYHFRMLLRCNE